MLLRPWRQCLLSLSSRLPGSTCTSPQRELHERAAYQATCATRGMRLHPPGSMRRPAGRRTLILASRETGRNMMSWNGRALCNRNMFFDEKPWWKRMATLHIERCRVPHDSILSKSATGDRSVTFGPHGQFPQTDSIQNHWTKK